MSLCTSAPDIRTNQARNAGTEHRIRAACLSVRRFWGCSPSEALPPGYQPSFKLGKHFIERISRLSRLEHHLATARRRLLDACHKRLNSIPSPLPSQLKIQRRDLDHVIEQYLAGQYMKEANDIARQSFPQLSPDIGSDDSLFNERFEESCGAPILPETPLELIDTKLASKRKQAVTKPTEDLSAVLPASTVPKPSTSTTIFKAPYAPMTRPALAPAHFPSGSSSTGDAPKQPPSVPGSASVHAEEVTHHHDPGLLTVKTSTPAKASAIRANAKRSVTYVKKTAVSTTGTPLSQKEQRRHNYSGMVPLENRKNSGGTQPKVKVPLPSIEEGVTKGYIKQRPTRSPNHEQQRYGPSVSPISRDKDNPLPDDGGSNPTSKHALPPTPIGSGTGNTKRRKTLSKVSSSSSSDNVRITRTQYRDKNMDFLTPDGFFRMGAKEVIHIPELHCHVADIADPDTIQYPVAVASSKGMYDRVENATELEELRQKAIAEREARRRQQSGHDDSRPAFEKSRATSSETVSIPRLLLDEMDQAFENKLFHVVGLSRCSARRGDFNRREHDYMDQIHQEFIEGFRKTRECFETGLIRLGVIEKDDEASGGDAVGVETIALDSRICVSQEDPDKSGIARMIPDTDCREEDFTESSPTIIDLEDYCETECTADTEYVDDFDNFMRVCTSEGSGETIKVEIMDQADVDTPTATDYRIENRIDDQATMEAGTMIDRETKVRSMYGTEPSDTPSTRYDPDLGIARNNIAADLQAATQPVHANDEQDDMQANKVEEILGSYSKAPVLQENNSVHRLKTSDLRRVRNILETNPELMINGKKFKRALIAAASETTKSKSAQIFPGEPAELKMGPKDNFADKFSSQTLSASGKGASPQEKDSARLIKSESVSSDVRRSNGPSA
ncbi:MAG: hypothetical protein Q9165_005914 [Trypethelium subeluteriae]